MQTIAAQKFSAADAARAVQATIIHFLEETVARRGDIEMLPGLPGAKRADEEVVLVGAPF